MILFLVSSLMLQHVISNILFDVAGYNIESVYFCSILYSFVSIYLMYLIPLIKKTTHKLLCLLIPTMMLTTAICILGLNTPLFSGFYFIMYNDSLSLTMIYKCIELLLFLLVIKNGFTRFISYINDNCSWLRFSTNTKVY